MAIRNGTVTLPSLTVQKFMNSTTASQLVLTVGNFTVTIDRAAKMPDDFNPRPGETVDITLNYDPRP